VAVVRCPTEFLVIPYFLHLANLVDLEPTPKDVLLRFASDEAPTSLGFLHPPEEAEKQEHISSTHALPFQMGFWCTCLSEQAPPLVRTAKGFSPDIGVQACETFGVEAIAGEVFNYLSYIDVAVLQVLVVNWPFVIVTRDWQRINRAIGEDGAGAASIRTVEPFSAER
jgi:hypothetical protein